jgi:hypothetical protein
MPGNQPAVLETLQLQQIASASEARQAPAEDAETCGVNVRRVPKAVWRRARQNALLSNLPFRTYVIRILERCEPLPSEAGNAT